MPKSQDTDRISDHADTFRHPKTYGRNPIPRIPPISDEFLSDPIKSDHFSDKVRWNPTVGLLVLGIIALRRAAKEISKDAFFGNCLS